MLGNPGTSVGSFGFAAKALAELSAPALIVMLNDSVGAGGANNSGLGCGYNVGYANCQGMTPPAGGIGPGDNTVYGALALIPDVNTVTNTTPPIKQARHLEGHLFGFADGHVKWLKGTNEIVPSNPNTTNTVWHVRNTRVWNAKHGTRYGDPTFSYNENGLQ